LPSAARSRYCQIRDTWDACRFFGGVEHARFRRQVLPGDTVEVTCEMTQLSARGGKGVGRATIAGKVAVETELFFILADAS